MTQENQLAQVSPHLEFCRKHLPDMLAMLEKLVKMESPSDDKAALDELGRVLAAEFQNLGARCTLFPEKTAGNHLKAEFAGTLNEKPVLLLGHFDTVWPLGTLAAMPFRIAGGRAFGPGTYDMKAGIVMMMFAIKALQSAKLTRRPITVLLDTDEEIGSVTGRPLVEETARACETVLVLEPSQGPRGHLKTSRKGVGDFTVNVRGRASHAGVDFEKGHSAVLELAKQIGEITKFVDVPRGITVNPGVVRGGTRTNVIAAEASAEVDVRVARMADAKELEQKFTGLQPFDPECTLEVTGGLNRPPMERTEGTVRLFRLAQGLARQVGLELDESSTGGGSDGNFTSAMGIPTLDGLGALGEGAHATNESVIIDALAQRTAVLAGLLESL